MIYKGTQKKMIMLKNTGSKYFEEAYFIIREEGTPAASEPFSENDMIKEANRIISETFMNTRYSENERRTGKLRGSSVFWFFAGSLCGSALTLLIRLII